MSVDLRDLYQDVILDHSKRPRNFGPAPLANRSARGNNPMCGDRVVVHLELAGETIADARFEAKGCAISVASASMMTEMVMGRTVAEARDLFARFRRLVTTDDKLSDQDATRLDKLVALSGVREFPTRVKCATLAWHAMVAALENKTEEVRTE